MDRSGEDAVVFGKDVRRAIALVHIEIDHQRGADFAPGQQQVRGDRHIVERAEARAMGAPGVVAAASRVAGNAMFERKSRCHDGARGRALRAHRSARGDFKTDLFFNSLRHCTGIDLIDIGLVMGQLDPLRLGWRRHDEGPGRGQSILDQHFSKARIFGHREPMGRVEQRVIGGVMDNRQGHHADICAAGEKSNRRAACGRSPDRAGQGMASSAAPEQIGSQGEPFTVTNRMVFAIAVPMTLAYLTTPLLGIVDTAVVGQFGDAALIGGLAIGAIIFDIVFVAFNFLRMGTTGLVAQAVGRGDESEQQAVFWRAIVIALAGGVLLLPLSPLIRDVGLWLIVTDPEVAAAAATYVTIRFLAAPFTLLNYAILGLLLGQARAVAGLVLQTLINGINIALSIFLGLHLGWNVAGVAWATVVGEGVVAIGALIWLWRSFDKRQAPSWVTVFDRARFFRLIALNRDIMIRSFALLAAFAMFTRFGGQFGAVTLAANAILMNFFMIAGYYLDGFAVAAEQLVGRAIGARQRDPFWKAIRLTALWGFVLAGFTTLIVLFLGGTFIDLMTTATDVRVEAKSYLVWAAITALAGVLAFQMDGVYIGATWSVDMRNMMLLSLAVFLACAYVLIPIYGNHGLWFALNLFLGLRGLSLVALLPSRARGPNGFDASV